MIFADKVVLYEGDTERLYIRKLLGLDEFSSLRDNYIAFIQVGGAYAINYVDILKELKIKSLIITDLDYGKAVPSFEAAKKSASTNTTINKVYKLLNDEVIESPTIEKLYEFQAKEDHIVLDDLICIAFQDENSTARTLEEAMLAKLLNHDVFKTHKRSEWKEIRKNNKLTFSIPYNRDGENDSEFSIQRIIQATSNNKTDFMYSVIMSNNAEKMLPDYIREGLSWLAQQ